MGGFDVSLIPMIFLLFQSIVVGLFVLIHIFLGRKRGVTKTLWFFAGEIILAFVLMWGIGLFQTNDWVNEAMVRQYIGYLPMSGELNAYMDEIVASGMLPLFLAIVDLSVKMSFFLLFYTILKFIFKWIIFGIPWALFIKPLVKEKDPNKTIGGLIGIFRGAFAGFFLIFPILIFINTVVGEGVELEHPEYKDLSIAISNANQHNFVKYVNDATKIQGTGIADFMFDLAFKSDVADGETIIWRLELEWISEVAKVAVPYVLEEEAFNFTLAELENFEGAFASFTNSQLINSSVRPLLKFSILMAANDENFTFLTEEEIGDLLQQVDGLSIDLANDLNEIYLSAVDLLKIQDYASWELALTDMSLIAEFDETDQALFIGALNRLVTLDVLNLADPALSIVMYDSNVINQITWLETNEARIELLNSVRQKINGHNGQFVTQTLGELVELFETTFYGFPGIDLDNDGTVDVTLAEFLTKIQDLSVVLNGDPNYHTWFKSVLDGVGGLTAIDVFMEPIMGLAVNQLAGTEGALTAEDIESLKTLIEQNFADQEDLQRELSWMADVYKAIGDLHIGAMLEVGDHPAKIMDSLLIDSVGQTLFKQTVDTFLAGQTISALTNQMSQELIARYVTEPVALAEPLNRAAELQNFNLKTEIDVLLDVLIGLYDEGMLLETAMTNTDTNAILETLLPSIVAFVRDGVQKDKLLTSNIIYSFLDYNLTSIPMLETPNVIYETSGLYDGWVKKTEIENLLSVLDGLLAEMENHNMDISDLLNDIDTMNAFFPVIKGYAQTSSNRNTLLSSDIIYKTIDNLIQDIDLVDIPETAVVDDTNSPYHTWTKRIELNKILESIVIMDLSVPAEGEAMNLDHITGAQINDVILIESAIMTRLLTTYMKDSGLIAIPVVAYETPDELDLKQLELEALGELLSDLNLTLGDLVDDLASAVSDLTIGQMEKMHAKQSLIMQKFMSEGIVDAVTLADIRDAAFSDLAMEMVDYDEITRLLASFNVVALSMNGGEQEDADDESITSVVNNLTSELSLEDIQSIALKDSMIVYRKITNIIIDTLPISIPTTARQAHGDGVDITQDELINFTNALEEFEIEDLTNLDIDSGGMDLNVLKDVLNKNSLIADRLISKTVTEAGLDTDESHEGMEDILIDIQKDELHNLVDAFIALGITNIDNAQTVNYFVLNTNAQTIGEAAFNGYIDYQEADPLPEDIGLTIVKDFLIAKLDDQIPNPSDPPNNFAVTNRQELNELFF